MKININSIKELLSEDLSITKRGLLITAILLREDNPKLTLAKLKATIKTKEYHQELIELHEANVIVWSGYKSAVRGMNNKVIEPNVGEVIEFMNKLYKRNFNPKSESSTKELRARLNEHSVEDLKKVISNRWAEWKDDSMMSKHLNPTTIFRASKFEKYLEEVNRTKSGQSYLTAEHMDINQGDEFTIDMIELIQDNDVYSIKTYDVDPQGNRKTSGMPSKVYGSSLKKMLLTQNNREKQGLPKEVSYIYQEK
jgi:uncharacterized phage protein (TIGR02220 family)|tara:strand:+ start:6317 stop:7075 length:759 start_codon:yes stop_codon:yes gene_type:complete